MSSPQGWAAEPGASEQFPVLYTLRRPTTKQLLPRLQCHPLARSSSWWLSLCALALEAVWLSSLVLFRLETWDLGLGSRASAVLSRGFVEMLGSERAGEGGSPHCFVCVHLCRVVVAWPL